MYVQEREWSTVEKLASRIINIRLYREYSFESELVCLYILNSPFLSLVFTARCWFRRLISKNICQKVPPNSFLGWQVVMSISDASTIVGEPLIQVISEHVNESSEPGETPALFTPPEPSPPWPVKTSWMEVENSRQWTVFQPPYLWWGRSQPP